MDYENRLLVKLSRKELCEIEGLSIPRILFFFTGKSGQSFDYDNEERVRQDKRGQPARCIRDSPAQHCHYEVDDY
jgi:hypothetical protein